MSASLIVTAAEVRHFCLFINLKIAKMHFIEHTLFVRWTNGLFIYKIQSG